MGVQWQLKDEPGAASIFFVESESAPVFFDDAFANGESKTGPLAFGFCGKKGITVR